MKKVSPSNEALANRIVNGLNGGLIGTSKQQLQDHLFIQQRYREYRMTHKDGFQGASLQARRDFIKMVLDEAKS